MKLRRHTRTTIRSLVVASAAVFVAHCTPRQTTGPDPTPTPDAPSIACPADQTIETTTAQTVVTYPPPVVTGGTVPLSTSCTIASGSTLPVGLTDVICTTRDAVGRPASCVFHVTITAIPRLQGTRFTTLGDSIANGEVAPSLKPFAERDDLAFPEVLRQLLQARYKTQTITMVVLGAYGQTAVDGAAVLQAALAQSVPDALLILQGVNDINSNDPGQIPVVKDALRSDVIRAKAAGVKLVLLSTLLPEIAGRSGAHAPDLIEPMNHEIRAVAAAEGAVLVDNYAALIGQVTIYIGVDGLHPTAEGHRKIAETFFEAIKMNFEVPLAPGAVPASRFWVRPVVARPPLPSSTPTGTGRVGVPRAAAPSSRPRR